MFLFWKYAKLNIFLIYVHKSKTTTKVKQNGYNLRKAKNISELNKEIYLLCFFFIGIWKKDMLNIYG